MTTTTARNQLRQIDDDECGVCIEGMIRTVIKHHTTVYVPADRFEHASDAKRERLLQEFGSLDRVPVGFDRDVAERGTSQMLACLCAKGRGKLQHYGMRSVSDVWTEDEMRDAWPNGLPSGVAKPDRAMELAGVPPRMQHYTITSFQQRFGDTKEGRRWTKYAATWAKSGIRDKYDLVLYGTNGTGKTGLAVAMLRGALEQGETVKMCDTRELAMAWRDLYKPMVDGVTTKHQGMSESEMLQSLTAPDILLLDDVTAGKISDWIEQTLTLIVDTRQKHFRATLLTLNVGSEVKAADHESVLSQTFGPMLFDRLRERGQFWPMLGDSKRETFKR